MLNSRSSGPVLRGRGHAASVGLAKPAASSGGSAAVAGRSPSGASPHMCASLKTVAMSPSSSRTTSSPAALVRRRLEGASGAAPSADA